MTEGPVAALFPGQNSHAIGMGQALAEHSPAARQVMDTLGGLYPEVLALMSAGPLDELTLTANQQPALVAASVAAYRAYLAAGGPAPQYAAGHSLGEYSAHVAAGTLSLEDALRLTRRRGELMQQAVPAGVGAMAAVMGDPQTVAEVCASAAGVVEVANLNAPTQTVISGEAAAVAAASSELKSRGLKVIPLKVSAPFHCSLMAPARAGLEGELQATSYGTPAFLVVANVTAQPVTDAAQVPALLARQITGSVRWVETVQTLAALGVTTFIEFGPGTVLSGLVRRILPDARTLNIGTPDELQAALA